MGSSGRKRGDDDWEQVEHGGGLGADSSGWETVAPVEFPATTAVVKRQAAYAKAHPQVPTEPDPGGWRTAGVAASNTLTAGFAPKIEAAAEATLRRLKYPESPNWRETYDAVLNRNERLRLGAQQNRPGTYMGTSMAAGLPAAMLMPNTLLGQTVGFGTLGAAQGLGESKHFLGTREQQDGKAAFDDALTGGLWGAAGGAAGYGLAGSPNPAKNGGLPRQLLRSADWLTDKSLGSQTVTLARKLKRAKPKDLDPGEWSRMWQDADITGGWRSGEEVAEAAKDVGGKLGAQWGNIPKAADAANPAGVSLNRIRTEINDKAGVYTLGINKRQAAVKFADDFLHRLKLTSVGRHMGRSFDEVEAMYAADPNFRAQVDALKEPFVRVTHEDLQNALRDSKFQQEAMDAYAVPEKMRSDTQNWVVAAHKGIRAAQDFGLDQALGAGTGKDARQLRRMLSMVKTGEEVAGRRAEDITGHEFLGLPGWAMLGGGGPISAGLAATGHGVGAGIGAAATAAATGLARQYRNELYNLGSSAFRHAGDFFDTKTGRFLLRTPMEEAALQVPPVWRASNVTQDAPEKPEPPKAQRPKKKLGQNNAENVDTTSTDADDLLDQLGGSR